MTQQIQLRILEFLFSFLKSLNSYNMLRLLKLFYVYVRGKVKVAFGPVPLVRRLWLVSSFDEPAISRQTRKKKFYALNLFKSLLRN